MRSTWQVCGLPCRRLPAGLSAATQLTSLLLTDAYIYELEKIVDALPCSLQQLRLSGYSAKAAAEDSNSDASDSSDDEYEDDYDPDAAILPSLPDNFVSLGNLQRLQLAICSCSAQSLPSRWVNAFTSAAVPAAMLPTNAIRCSMQHGVHT